MTISRETLRDNINTFTDDADDGKWSPAQKNLAINLAIRNAVPNIKKHTLCSFALASASYVYIINHPTRAITTVTRAIEWQNGPAQIWISTTATTSSTYREMRGDVQVRVDGAAWSLEFNPDLVKNRGGHQVQVHYEQAYPVLGADSETTVVPEAFINPRALFHLCSMMALKGHHTDVQTFRQMRPDFYQEAEDAKARHTVRALPRVIKVRWE